MQSRTAAILALLTAILVGTLAEPAGAHDRVRPPTGLDCENGRFYPIRPLAVSDLGDFVTGYIATGRGRRVHIRLIPMGDGYRYAGRGVWFDGVLQEAVLYWGTPAATACTVVYG
jgi:hypothetical protein